MGSLLNFSPLKKKPRPKRARLVTTDILQEIISCKGSEYRGNLFYHMCSKELNTVNIKKLFLKVDFKEKINGEFLTQGLLGAIEGNQEKYLPMLLGYMEKSQIVPNFDTFTDTFVTAMEREQEQTAKTLVEYMEKFGINSEDNFKNLQMLVNAATSHGSELATKLDQKHGIIQKSFQENLGNYISLVSGAHFASAEINHDGTLSICGGMGGEISDSEAKRAFYGINPVLFNLDNFNPTVLDTIFSNDYQIHPSIVTHALVKNVWKNNREAVMFLMNNQQCLDTIVGSDILKTFIQEPTEFQTGKKDAQSMLAMLKLTEELPQNNMDKTKKMKI